MFFGVMEYDRQYEGTCMLLHRHPFVREHHPQAAVYADHMMIVINKLFCLLPCANCDSLVWVDLVK